MPFLAGRAKKKSRTDGSTILQSMVILGSYHNGKLDNNEGG